MKNTLIFAFVLFVIGFMIGSLIGYSGILSNF